MHDGSPAVCQVNPDAAAVQGTIACSLRPSILAQDDHKATFTQILNTKTLNYFARLRCLRMTTEGLFSEDFRLPSTARCPVPVLLVTAAATVFLEPLVLKPCQFSAGSALRCRAATALFGLP